MIGVVAYVNTSRHFALITPSGRSRASDIYCAEVWWYVGGVDLPFVGQIVEFDLTPHPDGQIEAVRIRLSELRPASAGINDQTVDARAGAAPAAVGDAAAGIAVQIADFPEGQAASPNADGLAL
ncbi:hypothetical protein [Bradyrhizobium sp. USDA 4506]